MGSSLNLVLPFHTIYDQVGNRTSSHLSASYTTSGFNKLTATATATYTYDANGNMTSKVDATGTTQYIWDYENRLKQVIKPSGDSVSYKYDGLGRRVERTLSSDGGWTRFTYDGLNVFLDGNSDGTSKKYINALSIDNKLGQITNNSTQYFLKDHLGSTSNVVDSSGNVTESTTYDAYGKATTNLSTRYQYTGREHDDFSGLQYNRARWYDAKLGRFISEDPIGLEGGLNQYRYGNNNPASFRDPTGEVPVIVIPIVIGVAALILTSPSYVNAPAPCDPVYRPENPLLFNAVAGAAGGLVLGKAFGLASKGLQRLPAYRTPVKIPQPPRPRSSSATPNNVGPNFSARNPNIGRAPEYVGGEVAENRVLDLAEQYLGKGYSEVGKNSGRYVSNDGLRQFRLGAHEVSSRTFHAHFEALNFSGGQVIENTVVHIVP